MSPADQSTTPPAPGPSTTRADQKRRGARFSVCAASRFCVLTSHRSPKRRGGAQGSTKCAHDHRGPCASADARRTARRGAGRRARWRRRPARPACVVESSTEWRGPRRRWCGLRRAPAAAASLHAAQAALLWRQWQRRELPDSPGRPTGRGRFRGWRALSTAGRARSTRATARAPQPAGGGGIRGDQGRYTRATARAPQPAGGGAAATSSPISPPYLPLGAAGGALARRPQAST